MKERVLFKSEFTNYLNMDILLRAWVELEWCYITYDMDIRFIPSNPVCFDKLSGCD